MPKVCLDPGHGGYDPGAVGYGLLEKIITLAICLMLKIMLEHNGIEVILTRDGDYAPGHLEGDLNGELQARVAIAEQNKVDLFVSVHINAGGGTGQEILVAGMGGHAEAASRKVLPFLVSAGSWQNRGVKTQNVLVLRDTSMPAILTESGFIDSASDTAKLKDPAFLHAIAVAHARGLCDYFGVVYADENGPVTIIDAPPVHIPAPVQVEHTTTAPFVMPRSNATCVNDDLFIRDVNGVHLGSRQVDKGDRMYVLDVGYTSGLLDVEYPTKDGVSRGFVKNIPSLVQYDHHNEWLNGTTPETGYSDPTGTNKIGSINPHDRGTILYKSGSRYHVMYGTVTKGADSKSVYVDFPGL